MVTFDHRGHASGIRTRRKFRLEDCADDVAELLVAEDAGAAVTVGYSMPLRSLSSWRRPARY